MRSGDPSPSWWNDAKVRGLLYQIMLVVVVVGAGAFLLHNTLANLDLRHIATGFGFLDRQASFDISESPIDYTPADSYLRALAAGLANTAEISVAGVVLATLVGFAAGLARLSGHPLMGRMAGVYVELIRNIPLLLQLLFWYELMTEGLPSPRQAWSLAGGIFLSNRGLKFPLPAWEGGALSLDMPELAGFNFAGGGTLSPECAALLFGLVLYTGAFIAEIVRGGVLAVPRGQTEAGLALGLSRRVVMGLVVLPQSLRVILPPLISQYLNLIKNSTLAVAIGYPDFVNIANTTINQTGQAVEGVFLIILVYLSISLALSGVLNWYNRHLTRGREGSG
jgi:general L-amino acid transport system permease protein